MTPSPEPGKPLSETKHTPTPWEAPVLWDRSGLTRNKITQDCQPGGRWKEDTADICYFPEDILNRANAQFIVTAVNAYDDLQAKITHQAAQIRAYGKALEDISSNPHVEYDEDHSMNSNFDDSYSHGCEVGAGGCGDVAREVLKQYPLSGSEEGGEENK